MPLDIKGIMPNDDGNLILNNDEKIEFYSNSLIFQNIYVHF